MQETWFDLWAENIPLEKNIPVFLFGEFQGQRSLAGYTVQGAAKSWTQLSDFHKIIILAVT